MENSQKTPESISHRIRVARLLGALVFDLLPIGRSATLFFLYGLADPYQERLYDQFNRANQGTVRQSGG